MNSFGKNLLSSFLLILLTAQICNCLKNCSYKDKQTMKIKYNTCADNLVCCENSYSMFDACCPDETHYIMPINLNFKNILFILGLFFGIIFFGAVIITIMMSISSYLAKRSLKDYDSPYRSSQIVNSNHYHKNGEYL